MWNQEKYEYFQFHLARASGLGHTLPEQIDFKDAYVYTDLNLDKDSMKMYKDSDWAITKSKDHKDCKYRVHQTERSMGVRMVKNPNGFKSK